jgi:hypothetical protein
MAQTQPDAVSSESTWPSRPGCQLAAPSVVSHNAPPVRAHGVHAPKDAATRFGVGRMDGFPAGPRQTSPRASAQLERPMRTLRAMAERPENAIRLAEFTAAN